jgi:N-acetylglucosaminyl-diphospho-decaprenol L-rhamnosyltransferase
MITVSIVSHNHGNMIKKLIFQLIKFHQVSKIIITLNVPEKIKFTKLKKIKLIINKEKKGFGENHNQAFNFCKTKFFCVLNPDIIFVNNPFNRLISKIISSRSSLIAPLVINKKGKIEDSFRYFPTFYSILKKVIFRNTGTYKIKKNHIYVEWVAGMFMFFVSKKFKTINGFDNKYFIYYEDVDICVRLWKKKCKIIVDTYSKVIHDARRDSRKKLIYFYQHLKSMLRYFFIHYYRFPKTNEKD